jgi:hypothetical protein
VEGFFVFFLAWLFVDFFDFFVVLVGAAPVSGAIVGAPPGEAVWACESIGRAAAATNVSKANPGIRAFIRELLDQETPLAIFSHLWGLPAGKTTIKLRNYNA